MPLEPDWGMTESGVERCVSSRAPVSSFTEMECASDGARCVWAGSSATARLACSAAASLAVGCTPFTVGASGWCWPTIFGACSGMVSSSPVSCSASTGMLVGCVWVCVCVLNSDACVKGITAKCYCLSTSEGMAMDCGGSECRSGGVSASMRQCCVALLVLLATHTLCCFWR